MRPSGHRTLGGETSRDAANSQQAPDDKAIAAKRAVIRSACQFGAVRGQARSLRAGHAHPAYRLQRQVRRAIEEHAAPDPRALKVEAVGAVVLQPGPDRRDLTVDVTVFDVEARTVREMMARLDALFAPLRAESEVYLIPRIGGG